MPFWQGIIGARPGRRRWSSAVTGDGAVLGRRPDLAARLLLPARLRRHDARLHRRPRREQGPLGWLRGFLIAQIYTPYTWFLWPVLLRSTVRQLTERGDWAKTEREPLTGAHEPPADPSGLAVSARRAPDPEHRQRLQRQPRPERPARDLVQVEAADLLRVDRHVDVGGEDGEQQRQQPPAAEAAGGGVEDGERRRAISATPLTDDRLLGRDAGGTIAS